MPHRQAAIGEIEQGFSQFLLRIHPVKQRHGGAEGSGRIVQVSLLPPESSQSDLGQPLLVWVLALSGTSKDLASQHLCPIHVTHLAIRVGEAGRSEG